MFQPHLPVRLPCYDLAPVASSALNSALQQPSSGIPNSHGLTGGVYKVRERIHRIIADMRLLAIPGSRGIIASPDPYHEGGSAGYPFLSDQDEEPLGCPSGPLTLTR